MSQPGVGDQNQCLVSDLGSAPGRGCNRLMHVQLDWVQPPIVNRLTVNWVPASVRLLELCRR